MDDKLENLMRLPKSKRNNAFANFQLINNSEPLPENDGNNNTQIESNNMELVSSNVQEVKNNTNVSTNEQQILQQQNFNTTSSSWDTQPNNLENFDREHHHKFRNHHSPNSQ
ncbi:241_t:CDS:2 [Entrophospora sp. SA101]|nr:241_t:CDS:2 [Entrophospora sp. SA101]